MVEVLAIQKTGRIQTIGEVVVVENNPRGANAAAVFLIYEIIGWFMRQLNQSIIGESACYTTM